MTDMKTPEQIADQIAVAHGYDDASRAFPRPMLIAAIEADRAQRHGNPLPLPATGGGVFTNAHGDKLVELADVEDGVLILVRANGNTATLDGSWSGGVNL